jgi:hypothetical protein
VKPQQLFLALLAGISLAGPFARADEAQVVRLDTTSLAGWETKNFKGSTTYSLVQDGGRTVIKAHSKAAASGLIRKVTLDPARFRYLHWSWKIDTTIDKGNERTKAGDDYAARVYVVFPGRFFWQTRAINYIWANHLPKGEAIPNAFTANAMMVAVESGPEKAGQWLNEVRDVLVDYRRLFGQDPREIGAIAIMTDTDNTAGEATGWYGDIFISTSR